MVQLHGITWGHIRGLAPMQATAAEYQRLHPEVSITWDVRSLKDFGDYPIELLCDKYDLIMLDHPFIGTGVQKQVIIPLDEWIPSGYLADQAANSVGASHRSYTWEGHQWALAVDAAAQVAAYRPDLIRPAGVDLPRSWADVFALAAGLPAGVMVGLPLVPTDAICSFISIGANLAGTGFLADPDSFDDAVAAEVLALQQKLAACIHPLSLRYNPPQMLDYMSSHDDVAYVPLLFGYSNYARPDYAPRRIRFTDIPSHSSEPAGAILGGVGLSVSSLSPHRREAIDYVTFVGSGTCQKGLYYESGGQPGHRSAWVDTHVNSTCDNFFLDTLRTMDLSYLRPRRPGYNQWQERGGEVIHEFLKHGGDRTEVVRALHRLYRAAAAAQ